MIQESRVKDQPRTVMPSMPGSTLQREYAAFAKYHPVGLARITWSSVIAGAVAAIAAQVLFATLGLAIGLSVPGTAEGIGIFAGIWWLVTGLISLFIGGWVAGRFAGVVNEMTERFQSTCVTLENERADLDRQVRHRTREVIQREQLASVGFLAAGVAHEINNPLASIAWSAEALEARLHDVIGGSEPVRSIAADQAKILGENLRRIQEEAYRCKGITERLLDFSRLGDVERTQVDICELVNDVVAMVGTLGKYRCKTLRADCSGTILALVNGQQIRQVALNLITNALESVDTDGAVDVRVEQTSSIVRVTVQDNGCGMTDEVLEHLFEPFFTRRRDGSGTGLGLSITHRIVTQHGGKLTAHSDGPGQGARLQLELPGIATAPMTQAAPQAPATPQADLQTPPITHPLPQLTYPEYVYHEPSKAA
jgi:signal transduction histidine kinase